MTDTFRAMCAEILTLLDLYEDGERVDWDAWRARARALLAEPEAERPSDEELDDWHSRCADLTRLGEAEHYWAFDLQGDDVAAVARAALARWGRPAAAPQPVAVSERWPEFSDCDPQEKVWVWNPVLDHWKLSRINRSVHTHWLPANALPLPTPEAL